MIPSLLQIPSAVSDSKLHSVLPNNGKGDFQFDRSTGATRINRDGLIEEVGYFSSELVQNGNFSELGSEIITPEANRDFSSNTGYWTLETGVTIENGKLNFTEAANNRSFYKGGLITNGKTYKLQITISGYVEGFIDSNNGNNFTFPSSNGTHTVYFVGGNPFLVLGANGTTTLSIDNISVKQVDPNDRWTLSSGVSFGNNQVEYTSGSVHNIQQSNVVEANKTYEVNIITSQPITVYLGSNTVGTTIGIGLRKLVITAASNTNGILYIGTGAAYSGNISFISVKEVLGDRPRLSYDITNGVVEDKPHLLLEPSSTNLVTFSEDLSQSYWTKSDTTINVNQSTSPDGNINADSIVSSTANSVHYLRHSYVAVSANTPYTYSFFIKSNGYTKFGVRDNAQTGANLTYNLETESVIHSASMTIVVNKLKDNWFKCSLTSTIGSNGVAGYALYLLDDSYGTPPNAGDPNNYSYTGDGVSGFYIYGFQLEEQSYATSYIPTAGTTITRAAETCNNSKPSVNSTEGVLYAEIAALSDDGTSRVISLSDSSDTNRVHLFYNVSTNTINVNYRVAGSSKAVMSFAVSDVTIMQKIAYKWKSGNFELFVNGINRGTSSNTTMMPANTMNQLAFNVGGSGLNFYGKVKGLAVYNEALSESQLMQLTGVTASSIYSNFVTRTASFTVEALNEVKKVIDNL